MSKCQVKLKKGSSPYTGSLYEVKFNLTMGELVALRNALHNYGSAVGKDVYCYLTNGIAELGLQHDVTDLVG